HRRLAGGITAGGHCERPEVDLRRATGLARRVPAARTAAIDAAVPVLSAVPRTLAQCETTQWLAAK
ncbi:MAG: hypothetical protein MUD07_05105, partial [Burkholderiaceae bacterium]|nr:hypothetical protein [Burkholderiaceae bacterium]